MKGTWLLPTRGRPQLLARFLEAALRTGQSTPGLVLYSDPADIAGVEIPQQSSWILHHTKSEGMGDKFREIWPRIENLDWVGWVTDDQVPESQGWDRMMISGLNGANVISCNDNARAPFRMCSPVFSGGWLRALGYLYAPGFWHSWWDDALERLGRATDTWWVCMEAVIRHDDPFQTGIADQTHTHSYGPAAADHARFIEWRRNEMDGAVRRIMALKAEMKNTERKVANA